MGGAGYIERWVLDNFDKDPYTGVAMVNTAENVAAEFGVTTQEQNDVTLQRYTQYQAALADGHAFQRRFMQVPFDVPDPKFRKTMRQISGDEGVHVTTAEGLAARRPVLCEGTVTSGGQTHPADGNSAMIVTTQHKVAELTRDFGADSCVWAGPRESGAYASGPHSRCRAGFGLCRVEHSRHGRDQDA